MTATYLFDTDILVDFLRGVPAAVTFVQKTMPHSVCYISAITVAELYVGVREGKERQILEHFVEEFQIAEMNKAVAQLGGIYKRDYGKSHGVGLADALIAASTSELGAKLVTLNKKHFPMLKDVLTPYKK